ncbi:MAG: hypothetical protein HY587_08695, partial [Candidatus Omnitrophica bacterium]|nr:hypothetical protein [Candidatus Omnitrophota bacterium]
MYSATALLLASELILSSAPLTLAQLFVPSISWQGDISDFQILPEIGTVNEHYTGRSGKVVIYVQDAHANYEAQKNIARILEYFAGEHAVDLIGVEGAEGPLDFSLIRSFPSDGAKQEVLDGAMRAGGTTGVEYFAMTREKPATLVGVDDTASYVKNVKQYVRLVGSENQHRKLFLDLRQALENLKAAVYSEELRKFDRVDKKFQRNRTDLVIYLKELVRFGDRAGITLEDFGTIE